MTVNFKTFLSSQKQNHLAINSPPSSHQPSATFCNWLLLLSTMFSRFIHVVVCISALYLSMAKYSIVKIEHILFIQSSVDEQSFLIL